VLQCVAVCCSVLQCVAMRCNVLQCIAVCCNVLQCVAVCCSVLQCVALHWVHCHFVWSVKVTSLYDCCSALHFVAVCCSALQCIAVRCSALQCIAVHCCALQCDAVYCHVIKHCQLCRFFRFLRADILKGEFLFFWKLIGSGFKGISCFGFALSVDLFSPYIYIYIYIYIRELKLAYDQRGWFVLFAP